MASATAAAGEDGNAPAGTPVSVASDLQAKGYKVTMMRPAEDTWSWIFRSKIKTKGQGLLGIGWQRQVSGKAIYVQSGNTWKAVDVNVKAEEKPPLFGEWAPVEKDQEAKAVTYQLLLHGGPTD
jgi:hypothetical protein